MRWISPYWKGPDIAALIERLDDRGTRLRTSRLGSRARHPPTPPGAHDVEDPRATTFAFVGRAGDETRPVLC